jgi:hypothetical protein
VRSIAEILIVARSPRCNAASKPGGISTTARNFFSEMRSRQFSAAGMICSGPREVSAARTPGESSPPTTMTIGGVVATSRTTLTATKTTIAIIAGITSVGITIIEITVRRSRNMSRSSFA